MGDDIRKRLWGRLLLYAAVAWVVIWSIDSFIDSSLNENETFLRSMLSPSWYEIWVRTLILVLMVVFAYLIARLLANHGDLARALRHSESRYEQIVNSTSDGVWAIDARGKTTFANEQMAQMLAVSLQEMLESSMYDFTDEESGKQTASSNMERRREGISEIHEFRFIRKDGTELISELQTDPLFDENGNFEGALALVRDLTPRRRAEEALREAEDQLEEARRMESLGLITGGIAHDFNNLLTPILAYARMAMDSISDPVRVYESIEKIELAASRAADLIAQLLYYTGKTRPDLVPLSVNKVAEDFVRVMEATTPVTVALELQLDAAMPAIRADAGQLNQVLVNLLQNAIEAIGDKGGRVALRTQTVVLEPRSPAINSPEFSLGPGNYVILEVRDDGIGMDEATRARIFEPFFTTKNGGRGLGLSALLGIVRAHGGALDVESVPGEGTSFRLYFPLSDAVPVTADSCKECGIPGRWTVLLVDDEREVLEVASQLLQRIGHRVFEALSGEEAIRIYERERAEIDCAVLDLNMPDMNGRALKERLQGLNPELPVVIATGYPDADLLRELGEDGLLVQKPYSPDSLQRKLEKACRRAPGCDRP
ncbi:MAG: PAS domain S-box protein [Chrysiogenetes bacterium]|nr:PAS domain S-box protein [Chrysiogenetes bacterium]